MARWLGLRDGCNALRYVDGTKATYSSSSSSGSSTSSSSSSAFLLLPRVDIIVARDEYVKYTNGRTVVSERGEKRRTGVSRRGTGRTRGNVRGKLDRQQQRGWRPSKSSGHLERHHWAIGVTLLGVRLNPNHVLGWGWGACISTAAADGRCQLAFAEHFLNAFDAADRLLWMPGRLVSNQPSTCSGRADWSKILRASCDEYSEVCTINPIGPDLNYIEYNKVGVFGK
jgi:hypothetical protein